MCDAASLFTVADPAALGNRLFGRRSTEDAVDSHAIAALTAILAEIPP